METQDELDAKVILERYMEHYIQSDTDRSRYMRDLLDSHNDDNTDFKSYDDIGDDVYNTPKSLDLRGTSDSRMNGDTQPLVQLDDDGRISMDSKIKTMINEITTHGWDAYQVSNTLDVNDSYTKEEPTRIELSTVHWDMLNHVKKVMVISDTPYKLEMRKINVIMSNRYYYEEDKVFLNEQRLFYLNLIDWKKQSGCG